MVNEVSISKIKNDAEKMFRDGKFYCSEAIVYSIKNNFELDISDKIIAMASGFPVGVGKSKCMCGAVSGGIMSLSYFFGREKGGDPIVEKNLKLAHELQQSFKDNHKVLCCSILTKDFDMASGAHKEQCISFTGEMAEKTGEIIVRELGLVNTDAVEEKHEKAN
ncbi:MAG TPA: C-GCAxxG-C-C family (seleno)protein [Clostridia bacterium]|nr:C-GCAxxG-C-C family (seleno)protein [Clostridia bacterium]